MFRYFECRRDVLTLTRYVLHDTKSHSQCLQLEASGVNYTVGRYISLILFPSVLPLRINVKFTIGY